MPHSPRHLRSPRASQTGRSPQPPSPMVCTIAVALLNAYPRMLLISLGFCNSIAGNLYIKAAAADLMYDQTSCCHRMFHADMHCYKFGWTYFKTQL